MKNFLLLAAMALAATTVSAKQVLENPAPWGDGILVDGVYNFNGSWQGAGTYLGTDEGWCNASAYDLCVLKYSGHTGGAIALGVVYNVWEKTESWGDVYKTESALVDGEAGYLTIKLNKTDITDDDMLCYEQIRQIQIQDQGSAATLVIEELSFMTQAEYDAETYDPSAPTFGWVEKIVNGDCEGTEADCFLSKEYPSENIVASTIADGAGKDGSRGIVVVAAPKVSQDWDTQFWIAVPEALESGAKLKVSFDYKASAAVSVDTQAHGEPGDYHHWQMCGTVSFGTEWKTLEWEGKITDAHAGATGFRTIAFNLTKADEVTYYFDNISVCVEEELSGLESVEIAPAATTTYNLMGQQTNATSGLLIRNGKLIMVK